MKREKLKFFGFFMAVRLRRFLAKKNAKPLLSKREAFLYLTPLIPSPLGDRILTFKVCNSYESKQFKL